MKLLLLAFLLGTTPARAELTGSTVKAKIVRYDEKTATLQIGKKRLQIERKRLGSISAGRGEIDVHLTAEETKKLLAELK